MWPHAARFSTAIFIANSLDVKAHPLGAEMYKGRRVIENFFCKVKEFKRIAMRVCTADQSFEAMIYLVAAIINSR